MSGTVANENKSALEVEMLAKQSNKQVILKEK